MRYFKVKSEEQAMNLSEEMYKLLYPKNADVVTKYLFEWLTNENGECVIKIAEDTHKIVNSETAIKTKIKEYLEETKTFGKTLTLSSMFSNYEEVDRQYLLDNGFIKETSPLV